VHVASVELSDFRNYRNASVALSATLNLLAGDNGQGKSNFLEALGLLSVGKSIRGAMDAEMVRWEADEGRLACVIADGTASRLEMRLRPGERKEVRIDGAPAETLADIVGILRTVHVTPDVIDDQFRSPSGRRRMLDILISQIDRNYLRALKRHRAVVAQMNALWKRADPSPAELEVWERHLATVAVDIVRRRQEVIERLRQAADQHFGALFDAGRLDMRLRPTLPVDDSPDAVERAARALAQARPQAERAGCVTRGAHRDQIDVLIDDRPFEEHASQGQVKGAYFAWKLAEGDVIEQTAEVRPLWLVDDPFSEMDRTRAFRLLDAFRARGQVIVTTARDGDLGLEGSGFARCMVDHGRITPI